MEDLSQEVSLRRRLREIVIDRQSTTEDATGVGGPNYELGDSILTQQVLRCLLVYRLHHRQDFGRIQCLQEC